MLCKDARSTSVRPKWQPEELQHLLSVVPSTASCCLGLECHRHENCHAMSLCQHCRCHSRGKHNHPTPLHKEVRKRRGQDSSRWEILALTVSVTIAAFVRGQTISRCTQQSLWELSDCLGCVSWRSTQRSHSVQWKMRSLEGLPGPRLCWHSNLHSTAENETSLIRAHRAADLLCAWTTPSSIERSSLPTKPSQVSLFLGETKAVCQEMGPSTGSNSGARLWPGSIHYLWDTLKSRCPGGKTSPAALQNLSFTRCSCLVHHKSGWWAISGTWGQREREPASQLSKKQLASPRRRASQALCAGLGTTASL